MQSEYWAVPVQRSMCDDGTCRMGAFCRSCVSVPAHADPNAERLCLQLNTEHGKDVCDQLMKLDCRSCLVISRARRTAMRRCAQIVVGEAPRVARDEDSRCAAGGAAGGITVAVEEPSVAPTAAAARQAAGVRCSPGLAPPLARAARARRPFASSYKESSPLTTMLTSVAATCGGSSWTRSLRL